MGRPRRRIREYDDPEVDQLAGIVNEHLARLESDPKVNAQFTDGLGLPRRPFEGADAKANDERPVIGVRYQDWAPRFYLDKKQAKKYIRRLEKGHTGRHDE